MPSLSDREGPHLEEVIEDLRIIFEKEEISLSEIDELEEELQSEEVYRYLLDLRDGSAPESALREELMAGAQSVLANLFLNVLARRSRPDSGGSRKSSTVRAASWKKLSDDM